MLHSECRSSWMVGVVLALAVVVGAPQAAGEGCEGSVVSLPYDHAGINGDRSYATQRVAPGDVIEVEVNNTCKAAFEYAHRGVELTAPSRPAERGSPPCDPGTMYVCITHQADIGTWLVEIDLKEGAVKPEVKGTVLNPVTLVIPVENNPWKLDFSSGFTLSELTDPVFAAETLTVDGQDEMRVVRDREAEDSANLGIAGFTHLTHSNWGGPRVGYFGPSFGLGIDERNEASYFVGGSWLFGDKGALTLGYQWGSVDRLPGALAVGDAVTDVNTLADLPKRVDDAIFFALSYSFLGGRDHFEKRVASAGKKEGSATVKSEEKATGSDEGQDADSTEPDPAEPGA